MFTFEFLLILKILGEGRRGGGGSRRAPVCCAERVGVEGAAFS